MVKKMFLMVLFLFFSQNTWALEETISLKLPLSFFTQTCPSPHWKSTVIWKGVSDKRASLSLGTLEKKKEEIELTVKTSLDTELNLSLSQLLKTCGLNLKTAPSSDEDQTLSLQVEILEFGIHSEKKGLKEMSEAKSSLAFHFLRGNSPYFEVNIGFRIENKGLRKKGVKQVEAALNDLYAETLRQVATNKQLREFSFQVILPNF